MSSIVQPEGGGKLLLLGNEAIVRGALEAGVAYVSTYPGTPSSEIGDTFYRIADEAQIYFEYSTNEKVALEFAMGVSFAGARSLCAMKHVGLNVAADALGTMAYTGVLGGMIVITADDPGCHSSQNEQDNRYYGKLANLPILEPTSPEEARQMIRAAFELSEQLELPFIFRTTTRISHMRAPVNLEPLSNPKKECNIKIEPNRFVCIPAHARPNHIRLLHQMRRAAQESEISPFNSREGNSEAALGIVTSGISYNYVADSIKELQLGQDVEILKIGFSNPFPKKMVREFLKNKEKILVVEELEPILENELKISLYEIGSSARISGKSDSFFQLFGEFNPDLVFRAVERFVFGKIASPIALPDLPSAPPRPPTLCPGCPHRASYFAVLAATAGKALFQMDIGCYTLGVLPPLSTAHHMIDMGSSINTAAAMSCQSDLPVFAFIGDSTFYHSGVSGLINAVHNRHRFTVMLLDNSTTAMTGHQPHPGSSKSLMHHEEIQVPLEKMIRGCGVRQIRVVDPNNLKQTIEALHWAMQQDEVTVIIARAPCALLKGIGPRQKKRMYQVNQELCRSCGAHDSGEACGVTQDRWQVLARSKQSILRNGSYFDDHSHLPETMRFAPCTTTCPAGLCVQGYITQLKAGNYRAALHLIREHIPFPSICGYVCDRPCEVNCVRNTFDHPLAIRALKHFSAMSDDPPTADHYLVRKVKEIPSTGKSVAIVGAGPAGLTAAHDLLLRGYQPVIYERSKKAGGIMMRLIPSYRLPPEVVEREIKIIELMGAEIKTDQELGRHFTLDELKQEHDAVLLTLGAGPSSKLGIEQACPELFSDGFRFLEDFKQAKIDDLTSKKIAVIGGGNAALDCARVAQKAGAEVAVVYRRTREQMPAGAEEIELAEKEGISFHFLLAPLSARKNGEQGVLELQVMKLGKKDSSGRPRPVPDRGKIEELEVDVVIPAVGQGGEPMTGDVLALYGQTGNRFGVDPLTLQTPFEKVFAAGDAVSGPSTIIWAIAQGKRAAWAIDTLLREHPEEIKPLNLPAQKNVQWIPPHGDSLPKKQRVCATQKSEGDWLDYTELEAVAEASRCLSCGTCGHCLNCVDNFACPAIYLKDNKISIDPLLCVGCGVCAQLCPNGAIEPVEEK